MLSGSARVSKGEEQHKAGAHLVLYQDRFCQLVYHL